MDQSVIRPNVVLQTLKELETDPRRSINHLTSAEVKELQKLAHRKDREKYNLTHPTLGTITKARAEELWNSRGLVGNARLGEVPVTPEENKIVHFVWGQIKSGSSCWMDAFFIYLNQED